MRIRLAALALSTLALLPLAACGTVNGTLFGDTPYTATNIVDADINPDIERLLAPYGYDPAMHIDYKEGTVTETGTMYLVCSDTFKNRADCAENSERAITNQHPGIVVMNGKLVKLIMGAQPYDNKHNRPIIKIPAAPLVLQDFPDPSATTTSQEPAPAQTATLTTWQDITTLTPGAIRYLLTAIPAKAHEFFSDKSNLHTSTPFAPYNVSFGAIATTVRLGATNPNVWDSNE